MRSMRSMKAFLGSSLVLLTACSGGDPAKPTSGIAANVTGAPAAPAPPTATNDAALAYFEGSVDTVKGTMTVVTRAPSGGITAQATLPYGPSAGDVLFHTCGTPGYVAGSTHQLTGSVQGVNLTGMGIDAFNAVIDSISVTGVKLASGSGSGSSSGIIASYGSVGASTANCASSQSWVFQNVAGDTSFTFTGHASGSTFVQPDFFWFDATDLSTITKNGSNIVSQWNDKSPQGLNATVQSGRTGPTWTSGAAPGGQNALSFNGTEISMQTPNALTPSNMTIFVVFNMVAYETWGTIANQNHDVYWSIREDAVNNELDLEIQNDNAAPIIPINANTWETLVAERNGGTSSVTYVSGATASNTADTLTGGALMPITLGNSYTLTDQQSMGGYIAEIRAYYEALTPTQISTIEANLAAKY